MEKMTKWLRYSDCYMATINYSIYSTHNKTLVVYEVFDLTDYGIWLISISVGIAWLCVCKKATLLKHPLHNEAIRADKYTTCVKQWHRHTWRLIHAPPTPTRTPTHTHAPTHTHTHTIHTNMITVYIYLFRKCPSNKSLLVNPLGLQFKLTGFSWHYRICPL